ncbi:gamma-glutamyl kinase [Cellulomonas bogoriensis 69B4 = DSM 16987]|uniref:Glutamate 5-kinase n=1 Tax=Cellulomonas bogoriensis 69B4 = DSM 16987 TaxID=1386082 RepID=A0A0A0BTB1_9CELL|nr:glutamate 5-kinase [Cellulomonas bogoriensis]KGM10399.1 gamma-glutamyl kinase [Cellulomonas bogoriensis 69B4 = DSM 16987]
MITRRPDLADARRVVVKVGSSSLTGTDGRLDTGALGRLVDVLADRVRSGHQVVLVTSGAIAAGIGPLGLARRPRDLATAQAAASVGQGLLLARYTDAFARHGLQVGQVLLTAEDTIRRGHYRNAQRALERLLDLGVVPVVNENDTVATDEIRFGDNDRLAALVSHLVRADALVLLTDVDGLHDGPPSRPGSRRISTVDGPQDLEGVVVTARGSAVGTGGMVTKLASVAIATGTGIPVVLTAAPQVRAALAGREVGTWFSATGRRMSRRRLWLAHAARSHGRVVLDDGAVRAVVERRTSLLPAGITAVEGEFDAGDVVELSDAQGRVVARGLVSYGSQELPDLMGSTTTELVERLGAGYDREVVHADDLVVVHTPR